MRRFTAAVAAFSFFCFGALTDANSADGNFCPPGANFCPVPGSSDGDNGSFGLDPGLLSASSSYGSSGGSPVSSPYSSRTSHFESQLNEGESLIMVAPSGQSGMYAAPSASYSDGGYAASGGYGDAYSVDSYSSGSYTGGYTDAGGFADSGYSSESYASGGFDDFGGSPVGYSAPSGFASSGGYASSGISDGGYNQDYSIDDFDDDYDMGGSPFGGGYIPPPPGGSSGGYSSEPAPSFATRSAQSSPSVTASPVRTLYDESMDMEMDEQPRQSTGRNYRPKKGDQPMAQVTMPAPASSSSSSYDRVRGESRSVSYDGRDYEVSTPEVKRGKASDSIPSREEVANVRSKKRRADILSEVANETSRNYPGDSSSRSRVNSASAERVPWWKGGMWRNRKANQAEKEEAKARKEAAKAAKTAKRDMGGR